MRRPRNTSFACLYSLPISFRCRLSSLRVACSVSGPAWRTPDPADGRADPVSWQVEPLGGRAASRVSPAGLGLDRASARPRRVRAHRVRWQELSRRRRWRRRWRLYRAPTASNFPCGSCPRCRGSMISEEIIYWSDSGGAAWSCARVRRYSVLLPPALLRLLPVCSLACLRLSLVPDLPLPELLSCS